MNQKILSDNKELKTRSQKVAWSKLVLINHVILIFQSRILDFAQNCNYYLPTLNKYSTHS